MREVEYGASRRGFEPAGTDINVPPPTLNNDVPYPLGPNEEDDGQYREDPSIYFKDSKYNTKPAARPAYVAPQPQNYNSAPNQYFRNNPAPIRNAAPAPIYNPQPSYTPESTFQSRFSSQPTYNSQPSYNPQPQHRFNQYSGQNFNGHPATNLDLNTGSYSLTYTGK